MKVLPRIDLLEASLDLREIFAGRQDPVQGHPRFMQRRNGSQEIVYVVAGHEIGHDRIQPALVHEIEMRAGARHLDVNGPIVRLGVDAIRYDPCLAQPFQVLEPRIIHVQDTDTVCLDPVLEQPALGVEVILHGAVEIQVVIGEIREHRRIEVDAVHTPLRKPMARYLQGTVFHARRNHVIECALQKQGIGSGQVRHEVLIAIVDPDRPDIPCRLLEVHDCPDDVGDGTLAVGARDAEHPHFVAGFLVKQTCTLIHCRIDILDPYIDRSRPLFLQVPGIHDARGPFVQGIVDEVMTIVCQARQTEIHIAGLHLPGIETQARDIGRGRILEQF